MPKAHPICIMKKVVYDNLNPEDAASACVREGKYHGISLLAEKYRKKLEERGWAKPKKT